MSSSPPAPGGTGADHGTAAARGRTPEPGSRPAAGPGMGGAAGRRMPLSARHGLPAARQASPLGPQRSRPARVLVEAAGLPHPRRDRCLSSAPVRGRRGWRVWRAGTAAVRCAAAERLTGIRRPGGGIVMIGSWSTSASASGTRPSGAPAGSPCRPTGTQPWHAPETSRPRRAGGRTCRSGAWQCRNRVTSSGVSVSVRRDLPRPSRHRGLAQRQIEKERR